MPRKASPQAAPLKRSTYLVLLALGDEEQHGYGIMRTLEERTEGRERILPGTLYAALARMVEEGLVEERDGPADDQSGGPPRRYYKRTARGREMARAESERLRVLLGLAAEQNIVSELA
jgi:DNA-binding PadR family transcriptional regulator